MIPRFVLVLLVCFVGGVWLLYLLVQGSVVPKSFFAPVSIVVGTLSTLLFCFDGWVWRWPGIITLSKRPDIRGTWKGVLQSDWKDENGETIDPIEIFMVIHQTFSSIYLRMLSPESSSVTLAAAINQEIDGQFSIAVIYRNEPQLSIRDRSPIHHGGMKLVVVGEDKQRLQGEYWTERKTTGSIVLTRISEEKAMDYESAQKIVSDPQEKNTQS